jgi:hypothetical protein
MNEFDEKLTEDDEELELDDIPDWCAAEFLI